LTYLHNWMWVIIPFWCRIHCTSHGSVHIITGRCHVIWFYCCSYTGISKYHKISPSLFNISTYFDVRYNPLLDRIHSTTLEIFHINTGPCHVIWFYCCSDTAVCNHHNISPSLFDISWQFDVRYNPLLVLYTLQVTQISPYKHWTLSCHMILLLFIYRYKNST
jgi:hypothetical protein